MSVRILTGDCRDVLRELEPESVHCVVTSPPYWGLRDYGTAQWSGGDADYDHQNWRNGQSRADGIVDGRRQRSRDGQGSMGGDCRKCGAVRLDRQIGLEGSFAGYIEQMRNVFAQVWRVLRKDGTVWLNLGDSYASAWVCNRRSEIGLGSMADGSRANRADRLVGGLKEKDLCGIPWRVAFALQADGWYLRSDIIWSKPNPMPESVTDRPTKAHEYIFLLSKSERYYYDAEAIREPPAESVVRRAEYQIGGVKFDASRNDSDMGSRKTFSDFLAGRNRRSVWEIATAPFSEAHFATFPPQLIEPCILAGCPKQCCAKCGAPWVREQERGEAVPLTPSDAGRKATWTIGDGNRDPGNRTDTPLPRHYRPVISETWCPSCSCNAGTVAGTVLDPFGGAGTTGMVADRLGRNAILIELNPEYADMAERRIRGDAGMFAQVAAE